MRLNMALRNAIQVRLTDEVTDWLLRAATQEKLPPSTYARKVLEQAARRDLQGAKDEGDGRQG